MTATTDRDDAEIVDRMQRALEALTAGAGSGPPPALPREALTAAPGRPPSRRPLAAAAAALIVVTGAIAVWAYGRTPDTVAPVGTGPASTSTATTAPPGDRSGDQLTTSPTDGDASTAPSDGDASTSAPDETIDDLLTRPIENLAIGDSVMLGAANVLADRGYTLSAVQDRQMADVVPYVEQLAADGLFGDLVVVHLGTNGPFSAATLARFLGALDDVPNVVVLNVHADRSWTDENNRLLAEWDRPGDNVWLVDWDRLADDCPGHCFAADGIHLTDDGKRYYADAIGDITGL